MLYCLLFASLGGLVACESELPPEIVIERDLADIQERDTLLALVAYNSTSYFLYRGEPLGYEYELLQDFAEAHDVVLKTRVVRNRDSLFTMLNRGDGDIVAARLTQTDTARVAYTTALYKTDPVVVQREAPRANQVVGPEAAEPLPEKAPPVARNLLPDSLTFSARLITRPTELAGEEVHVQRETAYEDRLVELSDQITGDIIVVEVDSDTNAEKLVREVSRAKINLAVAPENVAKLQEDYYRNIIVLPTIGPPQEVVWAVRRTSSVLQDTLNAWIKAKENQQHFARVYTKYFKDRNGYRERVQSEYLTSETGVLSPYDPLLQQYADSIGWDWLLLGSQMYQESRFKPRARSWAGAQGLMQLMPPTARQFGVRNPNDPEDNVRGATKFIEWLTNYWDDIIVDEEERLKFILASYNTGHGHVEDARRLAEKYGDDPNVWEEVAYWLLQKSKESVYEDPVVKYGFARGLEPVMYVNHILERYDHYRQFVVPEA
ncbi:MAG TPA: transglycosylase SLT domain-containing protein [Rhodothermales bacterium]|nr:transglycosylase SLT domain-containing protein [Rhodothermales bacterium]